MGYNTRYELSIEPEVLVTCKEVKGVGKEYPDIWRKYFKNGRVQSVNAQIVFEPFDEDSLQ